MKYYRLPPLTLGFVSMCWQVKHRTVGCFLKSWVSKLNFTPDSTKARFRLILLSVGETACTGGRQNVIVTQPIKTFLTFYGTVFTYRVHKTRHWSVSWIHLLVFAFWVSSLVCCSEIEIHKPSIIFKCIFKVILPHCVIKPVYIIQCTVINNLTEQIFRRVPSEEMWYLYCSVSHHRTFLREKSPDDGLLQAETSRLKLVLWVTNKCVEILVGFTDGF
jgi:hypothetical protein